MSSLSTALIILALMLLIYVAFQYSALRMKYKDLFGWYDTLTSQNKNIIPNIGPMRIALSYERPWLAQYITRPIPQSMAEFMIRLVGQERINPTYLLNGPNAQYPGETGVAALALYCSSAAAWDGTGADPPSVPNPLGAAGGGHIPYWSELVQGYRQQLAGACVPPGCTPPTNIPPGTKADLSLLTLWMHGYEEYIRQRYTAAATSVLQEWNFMFAADVPAPVATGEACGGTTIASDMISAGVGAAGVGAMMGAPEGGIGAVPGAIIGFIIGAGGSLFGKSSCL